MKHPIGSVEFWRHEVELAYDGRDRHRLHYALDKLIEATKRTRPIAEASQAHIPDLTKTPNIMLMNQ